MRAELRLFHDRLPARGAVQVLPDVAARVLYVVEGALALHAPPPGGTGTTLGANSAATCGQGCRIAAGSQPASVLRWELVPVGQPAHALAPSGADGASALLLCAELTLGALSDWLLRCDRVDFPAGGEALTHTHQGGGIRCLLHGAIRIETQGQVHAYAPLQAWFEAGPDPVYAATHAQQPSAFVRVMVLPRALLGGQSSIRYVRAEDLDRPKSQRYQLLVDELLAHAR